MILQRNLIMGSIGLVMGIVVTNYLLRPACIHMAKVTAVSAGKPGYASVAWSYGRGMPPISVIIDLTTGSGASGSFTADGELFNAEIPLSEKFSGAYILTLTQTHRILGIARTTVQTFGGTI
ncbi:MAG: hypothetical protein MI924_36050 [Chloroflexales bacterium]|nr:hypothetical protein [Chloroflexales bacterium]